MALFDFLTHKRKREKGERQEKRTAAKEGRVSAREEKNASALKTAAVSDRALADIIRPHVTERSRQMSHSGVYVFRVSEEATKHTIKQAIEALYRVGVERVRVMRIPSKPRRRGLTRGTKKGYKKAAVTLRAGDHIELFS